MEHVPVHQVTDVRHYRNLGMDDRVLAAESSDAKPCGLEVRAWLGDVHTGGDVAVFLQCCGDTGRSVDFQRIVAAKGCQNGG